MDGEFLLSVGTLEPRKNLERVFAAYGAARYLLPAPWPLVVVGPAGWGEDIAPVEGVVFAGSVAGATLAALYRRTRMLLYVPLVEGFGLPPLEAMHHGTPVVASRVPSTAGAALEVEPTDVAAITEAIVEVATVPSVRRRLTDAGAAHARTLTWRQTARAHVALVEVDGVSDLLALSVDVSAVPARPAGAGRYTIDLVHALARRHDVALTLWTRRHDGPRWRSSSSDAVARRARPTADGPGGAPVPEGLARPSCGRSHRPADRCAWRGSRCGSRGCCAPRRWPCTTVRTTRCRGGRRCPRS